MIVGVDQSIRSTGICYITQEGEVTTTVVKGDSAKMSLFQIADNIIAQIFDIPGRKRPVVFMESPAIGAFGKSSSSTDLIQLFGCLQYGLWKQGIVTHSIAPTTAKKWLTGAGVAEKADMKLHLYIKHKMMVRTSDEADAFALADMGYHAINEQPLRELHKYELEMLKQYRRKMK